MKALFAHGRLVPLLFLCLDLGPLALAQTGVPRPDHVVIVMEENRTFIGILQKPTLPYIHSLFDQGALFVSSFALTHPSEPNYLALFSGSSQGVGDDSCPHSFNTPNLGSELITAGLTFAGFSESLPHTGYSGCESGSYVRRHSPWINFRNLPSVVNLPFSEFPTNFNELPTVCFVIPNLQHDMHDGSSEAGDNWLRLHIDPYVQWARTNNSLLIVDWDEGDRAHNQIPTVFVGPMVRPGRYCERINHYNLLRTLLDMYGLPLLGGSARAEAITSPWTADSVDSPLTVELNRPSDGSVLRGPVNIELAATATASNSTIRSVEFFQSTKKLGEATNSPFVVTWTNVPPGDYCLVAHVTDDLGRTKWSTSVGMRVVAPPFPLVQGTYSGLFYESNEVRTASAGFFKATTTGRGTYSGSLQMADGRHVFSGQFDGSGGATNLLRRPLTNVLTLELSLDLLDTTRQILGRVSDGNWVADLQADRAVFNTGTNRAPWSGRYTMDLPDDDTALAGPAGDGVGAVTVGVAGNIRLAGTLADGTPVTQTAALSGGGQWPVYLPLYARRGLLLGWLNFTNEPEGHFSGRVNWIKPGLPAERFYPGGFTNESAVIGSAYHAPTGATNRVLNFSEGEMVFSGGYLAVPFTNFISIGMNNKFTNLGSNALTLNVSPTTGRWSGSVIDPASGRRLLLGGTVLQDAEIGVGYCLGTNQSGRVRLEAR